MAGQRREWGQVTLWVALMLPFFLAVIGLALDGSVVFNARRSLQSTADAAARAGATRVDVGAVRNSGAVVLDPEAAYQAAQEYLGSQPDTVTAVITTDPTSVTVQLSQATPTAFVRIVGIQSVRISATATATVRHGIGVGE